MATAAVVAMSPSELQTHHEIVLGLDDELMYVECLVSGSRDKENVLSRLERLKFVSLAASIRDQVLQSDNSTVSLRYVELGKGGWM